jgi:uncharacterized protein YjbI with pentapeptide repeats
MKYIPIDRRTAVQKHQDTVDFMREILPEHPENKLQRLDFSNTKIKPPLDDLPENGGMSWVNMLCFDGACFDGANIRADFIQDCTFRGASFLHATVIAYDFERCDFTGANFSDAELVMADFKGCVLLSTDFSRAHLKAVWFKGCHIAYANFEKAIPSSKMEFEDCSLFNVKPQELVKA